MMTAERDLDLDLVPNSGRVSEPPPSGPISGLFGPTSEPPASGVVGPSLFKSDAGPGYWLNDGNEESALDVSFVGLDLPPSRVVRLGPEAVWFARTPGASYRFQSRLQIQLHGSGSAIGPLSARMMPLDARARGPLLGLKLSSLSLSAARQLLGLLNDLVAQGKARPAVTAMPLKEEILEPARLHSLMVTLASSDEWGTIVGAEGSRVQIVDVTQEGLVQWRVEGDIPAAPLTLELRGYNSVYRMHLAHWSARGGGMLSSLPQSAERIRHRWFRRGRVDAATWNVEISHPLWELPTLRREVRDVSFGGLCFTCDLDADLVFPGLRVPVLKIVGPGGREVQLSGEVRFVHPAQGDQPAVCGMSVKPLFPEDEDAWVALVLRTLNFNTDSGPAWTEKMWELFTASGYFNLSGKTPEEFDELKLRFVSIAQRTAAETRLSCQAVWPSSRGVEASCSVLKAYEGTWMLHQVAKLRGAPRSAGASQTLGRAPHVLREIYLRSFEHAQADPGLRWAISFVEASVPWMQRSHMAFAERYEATEMAMALPFRLMEAVCADRDPSLLGRYDIGLTTSTERMRLLSVIAQSRPTPYIEALDLVPSRFHLVGAVREWGAAKLERSRSVVVARRGGHPVAAALLETGEMGTNLFRLLDSVRLFALTPDGMTGFPALLEWARGWYAERGRESFTYFCEDMHDETHARVARMRDLGEGRFWAVAADLLPEFLEYVFELTAHPPVFSVPAGRVVAPRA
jgi:hypothetical protein